MRWSRARLRRRLRAMSKVYAFSAHGLVACVGISTNVPLRDVYTAAQRTTEVTNRTVRTLKRTKLSCLLPLVSNLGLSCKVREYVLNLPSS
jgi:hypothetical protein